MLGGGCAAHGRRRGRALLAGKGESAAWLADAIGALAAFAPAADAEGWPRRPGRPREDDARGARADGRGERVPARRARVAHRSRREGTVVRPEARRSARGGADARERDARDRGHVLEGSRDHPRAPLGAPRVAIAAGPRVRVVGTSVADAVSAPAPADDVTLEADLRVDDAPGGLAVRAVPGHAASRASRCSSCPGHPRAALLVGDGAGADTAASPVVEIPARATQHVHIVVKGDHVEATVGGVRLAASLPTNLSHGDVALRAYPGVTLEATGWRIARP